MTWIFGLLPPLVLLGGALVTLLPLRVAVRYRPFIALAANGAALVALLFVSASQREPITLFEPSDILPALTLTLQWNGAVLPLGILMLLMLSARQLMWREGDAPLQSAGTLAVQGGALLFLAADNWTTITAAWLVVEFGLLVVPTAQGESRERVVKAFAWNLAAIVLWLTAGMISANEGSSLRIVESALDGTAALLVLGAVWIRCGLYPFEAAAPATAETFGVRVGVPMLLGGYLLARALAQAQGAMDFTNELKVVTLLVVGVSALLVAGQAHGADAFDRVLRAIGAPLLLLPFFFQPQVAPALAIWLAVGVFAAANAIGVAWLWRAQLPRVPLNALIWIMALAVTGALFLTPGFPGRVGMLAAAYGTGQLALWLLLVATMALILIPLWREILGSRETAPKAPTWIENAAFGLVVAVSVAAGVLPAQFVGLLGETAGAGTRLFAESIVPSGARIGAFAFLLAGLLVPLIASFELARRWERRASLLPHRMMSVLDLTGVSRALDLLYRFARALLQRTLTVLEQPPIAWLIFLAIWVAVWLRGLGT